MNPLIEQLAIEARVASRVLARLDGDVEHLIAKGVSQYDAAELSRIKGRGTLDIERLLGYAGSEVIIHRDDMVLL